MHNYFHITSTQIEHWSKTKQAQANLPRLIRRLIHATTNPKSCDFPAGDSTSLPGWDGELVCRLETPWTPEQQSYWELSCEDNPTAKANRDYAKRTKQTDEISRRLATLVIVTARKWRQKKKWLKSKYEVGEWKSIRAFDADNLEQWMEQCPSVALQFADELGISGPEVESIEKYWNIWSRQALPVITPDSFHTSREHSCQRLINDIRKRLESGQAGIYSVKADSVDEAVAFTCSTLLTQPDLRSSSLVVTDSAGWRFVDMHPSLKVAIAAQPEIAERPSKRSDLVVVIPYAAGDMCGYFQGSANLDNEAELIIERPDIYKFEKALTAMGHNEGDAHRIAANTGRSWSVYRRSFAENRAICKPAWLDTSQAAVLSTVCLLGAWSGDNGADQDIVSALADCAYEEVEKNLRSLSHLDDAPVLTIGKVWKAKSALELLNLFGHRITQQELDRFFNKSLEILSVPDPELELPDEKRYAAQIYGKSRPESGLLIHSLCDTLIKLAVVGINIPTLADANIEDRVARLVSELLNEADGTRWLSLSSFLPALAEAAPNSFLKAIENNLNQPDAPVGRLITETGNSSANGRCWHASLLWALETLAWSPKLFTRVALILARLVGVPYRNKWGNTPMASLVRLFRSWYPQTSTNIQQRIATLDVLIAQEQDVAFDLLDHLLLLGSDVASPAQRPKWRSDDAGFGRGVNGEERMKMLIVAADRLIVLAEKRPLRLVRLLEKLSIFDTDRTNKILSLINPYTQPSASDEDREIIRAVLRKIIRRSHNSRKIQGKELNIDLDTMKQLYHMLEPVNLLIRYRWIFANGCIEYIDYNDSDDYKMQIERIQKLRFDSLLKIKSILGMDGVEGLALSCENSYWVGTTLARLENDDKILIAWLVNKSDEFTASSPLVYAMQGLLQNLELSRALALATEVVNAGKVDGWSVEKIARFMLLMPQWKTTWDKVATYGSEIEKSFWSAIKQEHLWNNDAGNLHFLLDQLIKIDRPRSALEICDFGSHKLDALRIVEILEQILLGKELNWPLLDGYRISKALELLRTSQLISKERLIRLEFGFIPALGYDQEYQAKTLYEAIMTEPALFTELLCILYKPKHGEREKPPTEAEQGMAEAAWSVFHACQRQPGTQPDGNINQNTFIQFIDEVRELCTVADRIDVCDYMLGQILAHAPTGIDGVWPFQAAREILDRPKLEVMRRGFQTGVKNKRGMTCRDPYEGGDQERKLADYFREQGQALAFSHVNLADALEQLACWYESDGKREDLDAKFMREIY
ncbi:MAG: hypothetical protein WCI11_13300 [Candidatus Methylumidiphilus sp.]